MVIRHALLAVVALGSLAAAPACFDGGDSKTAAGYLSFGDGPFGPRVVFDPLAKPIPLIPFPNDVALVARDTNAAGLAWNISTEAPTQVERDLRGRLDTLDGFGTFAPISVGFDGPIDLDSVTQDSVVVVNIEPGHPHEGERTLVDLGDGYYPLDSVGSFWPYDDAAALPDFLLPADNDYPFRGEVRRVTHYEVATHTLLLRVVEPLDPGARYAVLLTEGIVGDALDADGHQILAPIRSPFPYKAHAAQTADVAHALALTGISADDLAFGWTFTTADAIRPLEELRDGLHGAGPMAELAAAFPATLGDVRDTGIDHDGDGGAYPLDPHDNRFILQGDFLSDVLGVIAGVAGGANITFEYVDYVAFGSLPSPDIRTGPGRTVGVNPDTGEGAVGLGSVPYLIAVPRTTERFSPPFPVVFYFHGTATSRFEFLALADNLARQGIATVAFDQVGHGPIIPDIRLLLSQNSIDPALIGVILPVLANYLDPDHTDEYAGLGLEAGLEKLSHIGFFAELALIGRTTDETGDGALESGESFFFADPFKQCAAFHQDLVDFMQFVRTVRALDPGAVPTPPANPRTASAEALRPSILAGDFNADGVLDVGGPDVAIGVAGTSLGGIHAVMAGAIEPEVRTITPIVAGGGLSDILLRSGLRQITRVIYLEVFGPLVVGCPDGQGGLWLSFNNESDRCRADLGATSFAHLDAVGAGAAVTVENLDNGELEALSLAEDGAGFSLGIAADRWDTLRVSVERPATSSAQPLVASEVLVQSPFKGLGLHRNTPELRRVLGINQHVLDRCDPVNFARHIFLSPRPGQAPKSVLFENALQDSTVPISTGVTLARAAGVLGTTRLAWLPVMERLITRGVLLGSDYDPDDLLHNNPADARGIGPLTPVASGTGVSAIRFANVRGKHEWIAQSPSGAELDDAATYTRNQIALFHLSGGASVVDDLCIQDNACPGLDDPDTLIEAGAKAP
ncbi:MAG: hypothetical protein CVU56_19700 [Deltaproteobacteria bacterium HGW-Deltaproteobacteria-14]|jgi:hypothetical protein|nr:MAG: hypothetical protein CVU56_19700 [Deltaproteobacteria bacterium HGW-Deltaproteobacteria-14]